MSNLEAMDGVVAKALRNLGIERFDVTLVLVGEWETLAPEPWRSQSRPVLLKGGELLVEAKSTQAVSLLRYAVGNLLKALDDRFGEAVVGSVRIQPPRPESSPT